MDVRIYDLSQEETTKIEYVVILVKHRNQWILSRHKERSTWEFAGGHIEVGETSDEAASRELYEETGAEEFSLYPVAIYSAVVDGENKTFGKLYLAFVGNFGRLPDYEMAEVKAFEEIPHNLTYPDIYPPLIERGVQYMAANQFGDETLMISLPLKKIQE